MNKLRDCLQGAGLALLLVSGFLAGRQTEAERTALDGVQRALAVLEAPEREQLGAEERPEAPVVLDTSQAPREREAYLGILEIPILEKRLPVQTEWSPERLETTPCSFAGSPEGQWVVAGHNYPGHFGGVEHLTPGDAVYFADLAGDTRRYRVAETQILEAADTEEVEQGGWDLSLLTCTAGARKRICVRCRLEETP